VVAVLIISVPLLVLFTIKAHGRIGRIKKYKLRKLLRERGVDAHAILLRMEPTGKKKNLWKVEMNIKLHTASGRNYVVTTYGLRA
jgi:hypothetical protein